VGSLRFWRQKMLPSLLAQLCRSMVAIWLHKLEEDINSHPGE
jgi:hypothetical protein